jgi:oligoendopeptidase F
MLLFSTNTQAPQRGALLQKTREFGAAVATHLVFFDLEIGQISDEIYADLIDSAPLAPYRHYIKHQRQLATHNLSESEEKILVETASTRGRALGRLFTEIHGRAKYRLTRDVRRSAAKSLTKDLKRNAHTCTFIYNTLLHEKDVLDRLRHYPIPESNRHLQNELSYISSTQSPMYVLPTTISSPTIIVSKATCSK